MYAMRKRFCRWNRCGRYGLCGQDKRNCGKICGCGLWFSVVCWLCGSEKFFLFQSHEGLLYVAGCGWCGAGVGTEKNRSAERKIGGNESRRGDDALWCGFWRRRKGHVFLFSGEDCEKHRTSFMGRTGTWSHYPLWKYHPRGHSCGTSKGKSIWHRPQFADLRKDACRRLCIQSQRAILLCQRIILSWTIWRGHRGISCVHGQGRGMAGK